MDNLPPPLITEILSRLTDSSDITRCRLTCKSLNSASYDVTAFRFFCSYDRYTKSQAYPTTTRFKPAATRLLTHLTH
ncbi:F-box protein, partial [Mycobacterium kansasii]